jgi:hypothetical protein
MVIILGYAAQATLRARSSPMIIHNITSSQALGLTGIPLDDIFGGTPRKNSRRQREDVSGFRAAAKVDYRCRTDLLFGSLACSRAHKSHGSC